MWILLSISHATCPEPGPLLRGIEEDVLAGNLADAQHDLDGLIEPLGCATEPVSPEVHRRFFQAQGMTWSIGYRDIEEVKRALAASRLRDATWAEGLYGGAGPEFDLWTAAATTTVSSSNPN